MDPGKTTGLAMIEAHQSEFTVEKICTVKFEPEHDENPIRKLQEWSRESKLPCILVYEEFRIRPGRRIPDITALIILSELRKWTGSGGEREVYNFQGIHLWGQSSREMNDVLPLIKELTAYHGGTRKSPYVLIESQEPVQAKNLVTNKVLERMGVLAHGAGSTHINDALRHAFTWLTLQRYLPVCRAAWGDPS